MIRDDATQRQVEAADPAASTWLSANAGSGKTRVLTDRVARLLLDGCDPQNILCLTYTKAAAAEMQNRLFKRLGQWAMMEDAALSSTLEELGAPRPELSRARTLFARAIETPGGLRIQTIHSFCAGLLRRFPLEAGVSPAFREMEDREAQLLRAEVAEEMAEGPEARLLDALAEQATEEDLDGLLAEIAARREVFGAPAAEAALRASLGLGAQDDPQQLLAGIGGPEDRALIARAVPILRTGKATDAKVAERLVRFPADPGLADLALLEDVFLTGASAKEPFSAKIGTLPTKDLRIAHPELVEELDDLMARVQEGRQTRLGLLALERSRALQDFARAFVPAYEAKKLARGLLDFDDLIGKAQALLTDPAVAAWVLFRLDGGIDHILVDEAQDTAPRQWQVIERLAQEFAAGEGAREAARTIFVVGDKKQSIYSFQGADPEGFDRMRDHFGARLAPAGGLNTLDLEYSFRSSEAVLRVVDETFVGPMAEGLGQSVPHLAFKAAMPGRVDLWPPVPATPPEKDEGDWTDPVDRVSERHHAVILAGQIADAILAMKDSETIPEEIGQTGTYRQRPVTEGDVLILVQRRSALFAEIIRACKTRGLQVAGADRLRVGAELAVRDVLSLLRFVALPDDDLALAEALRSPLLGWSEQALYALAQPRPGRLWQALRGAREAHPETLAILDDLRGQADFLRPYDLIERLLVRHDGRRRLLARLGAEAEDGLDALLSQALQYETAEVPSLTGFVEWVVADQLEIKRQAEAQGGRLRVMSVHGAKGLEAPIVILPDTAKRPVQARGRVYLDGAQALWAPSKDAMPDPMLALRDALAEAEERERRRLLYVAMTRAESWLILCAAGETGMGGDSWHAAVADGMGRVGAVPRDFAAGEGLRYEPLGWTHGEMAPVPVPSAPPAFADPGPPPVVAERPAVLSPSDLGGAKVLAGDPGGPAEDEEGEEARARGSLVHLLLEHLPAYPPEERAALGRRLIASLAEAPPEAEALLHDALGLIDAPGLSEAFGPGALAEVAITAAPPEAGGQRLHGVIDRLLVGEARVLAVDFKTNRLVPEGPNQVPAGLLRQMGAYAAMLRQLYPGRRVETALLWTAGPVLMPLPEALVDAALADMPSRG